MFQALALGLLLWRRADARRWLVYIFNSVVNAKLLIILSHWWSTTVSLETYRLNSNKKQYWLNMFASDWLKGRHKIDALLDPFQHSRGHYPLITEGNWATYLSFEVELCSSLYPPIGYRKRSYQTILLITIAKHSWLQLYNWVAMMIRRKNFACLNLQQNLQIWSPVFKDHVTTVSLLQEFSLNLKWHRRLCKKINSLKNLRGPFHYPLHIKY